MFGLANVHVQILVTVVLSNHHTLIDLHARSDEQAAAFLDHEEAIGVTGAIFVRDQRSVGRSHQRTFIHRLIPLEDVVHNDRAARLDQKDILEADDPAGWNVVLQVHLAGTPFRMHQLHVPELTASAPDLLDDRALVFQGDINQQFLVGFRHKPVLMVKDDLWLRDLQLVAFASHLLDQDCQVQLPAARDQEPIRAVGFLYPQGDVRFQFFEETFPEVT